MTNKLAWWIVGSAATAGVLYWLSHSWTVTGVVEAGEATLSYRSMDGGANVPTGSAQRVP